MNIKDSFTANKLSLNLENTKQSFVHKPSKKDNIPFHPPKFIISDYEIQREGFITFLAFYYLDQHLKWKEHINVTEKKLPKTYKARPYSDKRASTIHTFTPT